MTYSDVQPTRILPSIYYSAIFLTSLSCNKRLQYCIGVTIVFSLSSKKMLTGHSKAVIVVNCVFPFVAAVAVALRLYARRLKATSLKSSEYVILVALVAQVFLSNWSLLTQYRQSRSHILWSIFTVHSKPTFDSLWKLTRTQGATNGGMGQHVQNLSDLEFLVFGKVHIQCGITLDTAMHYANTLRSHFGTNFLTYLPSRP